MAQNNSVQDWISIIQSEDDSEFENPFYSLEEHKTSYYLNDELVFDAWEIIICVYDNEDYDEHGGDIYLELISGSSNIKEGLNDEGYFESFIINNCPEHDYQELTNGRSTIAEGNIEQIKKTLPLLPKELNTIYQREYKLSQYDSNLLIEDKETALFFNEICALTNNYKLAANIINGVIKSYLNDNGLTIPQLDISAKNIANLIDLIEGNQISNTIATSKIFPLLISSNKSPKTIAEENNWIQESDNTILKDLILQALERYPEKIQEYKK